jgi:ATP-dependent Clp protease, protease subunit
VGRSLVRHKVCRNLPGRGKRNPDETRRSAIAVNPEVPNPSEPPAPQPSPSVAYVHFQGHIDVGSTASLLAVLAHLETRRSHASSLPLPPEAATSKLGMSLYEKLRSFSFHLVTHALATVQSMGIAVYLAGDERKTGPPATFMLHPSTHMCQVGEQLPVSALRQIIASLETSDARERSILEDRTGMAPDRAQALVEATTILNADEAAVDGIAQEITMLEVNPPDAPVFPLGPYPYPGEVPAV